MKTRSMLIRLGLSLMLALGFLGFSSAAALANPPEFIEFTETGSIVMENICAFDVEVTYELEARVGVYYDGEGRLDKLLYHFTEVDTLEANGITLVGLPFTFNIVIDLQENGELNKWQSSGVIEKIQLPDGSLFVSAGLIDWAAHPDETFIMEPDWGRSGDFTALCGFLTP